MKIRCCIVDDEPLARKGIEGYVERLPYLSLVGSFSSAFDLLKKLDELKPELLFMDIQMPVMDGYKASIEIRKNKKLNSIPIVAITADAVVGIKEKCIEVGMDDFISKPFDTRNIYSILQKYIHRKQRKVKQLVKIEQKVDVPEIPNFESINTIDGILRVNSNKVLYAKLLTNFYSNYGNYIEKIIEDFGVPLSWEDEDDFGKFLADIQNKESFRKEIQNKLSSAEPAACFAMTGEVYRAVESAGDPNQILKYFRPLILSWNDQDPEANLFNNTVQYKTNFISGNLIQDPYYKLNFKLVAINSAEAEKNSMSEDDAWFAKNFPTKENTPIDPEFIFGNLPNPLFFNSCIDISYLSSITS